MRSNYISHVVLKTRFFSCTSRRSCSILSRFLFFLVFRQDSFSIPSIQVSCLKKLILPFWQDSCRPNLGWWGKKFFSRQESCILAFLPDSCFSWILVWFLFFLMLLPDSFFLRFLSVSYILCFLSDSGHIKKAFCRLLLLSFSYNFIINFAHHVQKSVKKEKKNF